MITITPSLTYIDVLGSMKSGLCQCNVTCNQINHVAEKTLGRLVLTSKNVTKSENQQSPKNKVICLHFCIGSLLFRPNYYTATRH